MKVGILGGTFDPPHKAHLEIAAAARAKLGLERVIFMVAGNPRLKDNPAISPSGERLHMARLAIEGQPGFAVSDLETRSNAPTRTAETLRLVQAETGEQDTLYFIMGWDNLVKLNKWYRPAEIIRRSIIVAIPRPDRPRPSADQLENDLPGISQRLVWLDGPWMDISASEIRQRVKNGQDISHLVPSMVAAYIRDKGLYRV